MRRSEYKLQIGDVLYEASKKYKRILEWKITDTFLEEYVSGYKTVIHAKGKVEESKVQKTFYLSDILAMFDTREEAKKKLQEMEVDQ